MVLPRRVDQDLYDYIQAFRVEGGKRENVQIRAETLGRAMAREHSMSFDPKIYPTALSKPTKKGDAQFSSVPVPRKLPACQVGMTS